MILNYYGIDGFSEKQIADIMQIKEPLDNRKGIYGTSTERLVSFFTGLDFYVESSLNRKEPRSFDSSYDFRDWVIRNLKNGIPIMAEWIDWGGHWQIIVGYDTMGTESIEDDVIIFADPYDTSDHCRDGYYVFGAERFFFMWFDAKYFNDNEAVQQWLTVSK